MIQMQLSPHEDEGYQLPKNWEVVREKVNSAVKWRHLNELADGKLSDFDFDLFFGASDALCDLADVLYVAKKGNWPSDITEGHLRLYGTLQAMFVVRNACRQFARCLGIEKIEEAETQFAEVTEFRISAAGHPENHTGTKIRGVSFLTRSMPELGVFGLGTYPQENGKYIQRFIDVPRLLSLIDTAVFLYMQQCHNVTIDNPLFETKEWKKYS